MSTYNRRINKIYRENEILMDYFKDNGRRWLRFIPVELQSLANEFYQTFFGIAER